MTDVASRVWPLVGTFLCLVCAFGAHCPFYLGPVCDQCASMSRDQCASKEGAPMRVASLAAPQFGSAPRSCRGNRVWICALCISTGMCGSRVGLAARWTGDENFRPPGIHYLASQPADYRSNKRSESKK